MLERERLESKKISKTNAVTSIMDHELPAEDVYIGPSDYVPWLTDRKWAHIRVEGQAFGDVPLNVELKLEVWDSPNSAGIVIDAVRCCKLALNHGLGGQLDGPCSLPDEVPPQPAPRRAGARGHREVHREVRRPARPGLGRPGTDKRRARAPRARPSAAKEQLRSAWIMGGRWHRQSARDRPRDPVSVGGAGERGQRLRRRVAEELSRRGHRVLISRRRARRSGCAPRAGRCGPRAGGPDRALLRGNRRGRARGDRGGRGARVPGGRARATAPAHVGAADRRGAHDRGTAEHGGAGLRARARAVRAEHLQRGAAPLARAERRLLPRRHRAPALDAGGAALRGELLRAPGRPHREPARDGRADGAPLPRRLPARCPTATARPRRARGDLRDAGRAPARPGGDPGAAPAPGQAAADRRGPAHAHRPLPRLRDAGGGAARDRARAGAGSDRGDRPQRDLRRAGGARAGRGSVRRRQGDRRRGGQDGRARAR